MFMIRWQETVFIDYAVLCVSNQIAGVNGSEELAAPIQVWMIENPCISSSVKWRLHWKRYLDLDSP
jgi:hypothetical protein